MHIIKEFDVLLKNLKSMMVSEFAYVEGGITVKHLITSVMQRLWNSVLTKIQEKMCHMERGINMHH